MSKSKKQVIPPANVHERNVRDLDAPVLEALYEVASWRPGPAGSEGKPTEVHLLLTSKTPVGKLFTVLRIKSPRALNELVGLLLQYGQEVWDEEESS